MPHVKKSDDAPRCLRVPVWTSKFDGAFALVDFHTGSFYHATDERGHPKAFRRGGRAHPIFSPHRAKVLHGPARGATFCVEINQCVGCTKSFLDDDVAALAPSSGEEPTSPRHRAGVASMA